MEDMYPYIWECFKWFIIYLWTIISWCLGIWGMCQLYKLMIVAHRGQLVVMQGTGPATEYGKIDVRELLGATFDLAFFAAWWYMILK